MSQDQTRQYFTPPHNRLSTKDYDYKSKINNTTILNKNYQSIQNGEKIYQSFCQDGTELEQKKGKLKYQLSNGGQSHQIETIQKQHQSIVRGYELKLKNINEEYRRLKKEMQIKIRQLFHEKNHWQGIAMKLYEQNNIKESIQIFKQQNNQINNNGNYVNLANELNKHKEIIQIVQKQKMLLITENQGIVKQLQAVYSQNNTLKGKCQQKNNQIAQLKYQISQTRNQLQIILEHKANHQKQSFAAKKSASLPHKNIDSSESSYVNNVTYADKSSTEAQNKLIACLNEKLMQQKIFQLNEKYERTVGISYNHSRNSSKGGIIHPINIITNTRNKNI